MKQRYRVVWARAGVQESTHSIFEVEGRNLKDCNKKAKAHLASLNEMPENVNESLAVYRIIAPAVAEKVVFVAWNGRQKDARDWASYTELSNEATTHP